MKKGKIEVFNRAAFLSPAPERLKRIFGAVRYLLAGVITLVAGNSMFSPTVVNIISFACGFLILLTGGIEIGIGVKSEDNAKQ